MSKLNLADETFAVAYVTTGVAKKAYAMAFPVSEKWSDISLRVAASRKLNDKAIRARIDVLTDRRDDENETLVSRIMRERKRLAFADPRELFDKDGAAIPVHLLNDDIAAAVSSIETSSTGNSTATIVKTTKVRLHDKDKALTALEKIEGLYREEDKAHAVFNIEIHLE